MKTLDLRGMQCPQPVVQTRRELLDTPGVTLTVQVSDTIARDNILRLVSTLNYEAEVTSEGSGFSLVLTQGAGKKAAELAPSKRSIVLIGGETFGHGDPELGRLLLKNYLYTLNDMDDLPEKLYMVNSGVKLACAGADTVEILAALGCRGIDIASCGLCLDFFHLKEQLAVGRTTNMLEIASALQGADHVIRL